MFPAPVMYSAAKPACSASRAVSPSYTPGATASCVPLSNCRSRFER